MSASKFISSKLNFKGRVAISAIAISFFVIILAVAISSGFRKEIRDGVSLLMGDIQLSGAQVNLFNEQNPISLDSIRTDKILQTEGVKSLTPVIYRAGIVKSEDQIQGVLLKGVPSSDTTALGVRIPSKLSKRMGLFVGDKMTTYFIGEKVKVRKFNITEVYDGLIETDDNLLVFANIEDMARLNNWDSTQVSTLEVGLEDAWRSREKEQYKAAEIGLYSPLVARAAEERYSNLFDWLNLLDYNVIAILLLMILVAGFNMISGLLIMLFRNISTIGTLKAVGMDNKGVASVFLRVASRIVLKGMLIGNALALIFCFVQKYTHIIKLNPENYFVGFVPIHINLPYILLADVLAYVVIMLLLLIPSLFIAKVDPAETVRVK